MRDEVWELLARAREAGLTPEDILEAEGRPAPGKKTLTLSLASLTRKTWSRPNRVKWPGLRVRR